MDTRTMARRCAVQALYQWQLSGAILSDIEEQFLTELATLRSLLAQYHAGEDLTFSEEEILEELLEKYGQSHLSEEKLSLKGNSYSLLDWVKAHPIAELHVELFKELLHTVPQRLNVIDATISKYAERPFNEIDPIEQAVLRIGCYELLFKRRVPYRVIVNESINLARHFGSGQSHTFVNSVLDRLSRKHRTSEVEPRKR